MIESSTNAQIKKIQKLKKSARNRRKEGLFIAEGVRLVEDALAYRMVEKVYLSENVKEEYFDRLSHKLKEADIEYVSSKVFQEISDTESPQGVLAVVQMPGYDRSTVVEKEDAAVICLEDIQDPGNLGTIIRLADWFGIEHIFCSAGTADVYNPKTVQATMGALARVKVHYCSLPQLIESLADIPVYGTFLSGNIIYAESLSAHGLIVMGNEGKGVSPEVEKLINKKLYIPNYPQERETSESLNVAIATAVVCSEFRRRLLP